MLKGLTEMAQGYRIWPDRISTSYGTQPSKILRFLLLVNGLILIGNFIILSIYGDTLRSTHLFIVRSTVFYPFAWFNLIVGIILISILLWKWLTHKKTPDDRLNENK